MGNLLLVAIIQRFKDEATHFPCFSLVVYFFFADARQQVTALHFLHDDVNVLWVLENINETNNVRTSA